MLVPLTDLLKPALDSGYAVGSFNISSFEMAEALFSAAAECDSPIIVSSSSAETRYLSPETIYAVVASMAKRFGVTCALHLDHGDSFELAMRCLRAGYTSLMFDGSHFDLDENIRLTKQVVESAHAVGVSVEGEVGRLSGVEDDVVVSAENAHLTDVAEAARFAEETNIDALAVAIGNAHGFYLAEPKLDFERLRAIRETTGKPIVLHGGTGIPEHDVQHAITLGIAKINIASRIRRAFMHSLADALEPNPQTTDVMRILSVGRDKMTNEFLACMQMIGSAGQG